MQLWVMWEMGIFTVGFIPARDSYGLGLRLTCLCIAILVFDESDRPKVEGVVHRMVKRAVKMEGTVTGEHGVGLVKRDYLEYELGVDTVNAMRTVRYLPWVWLSTHKFYMTSCARGVGIFRNRT